MILALGIAWVPVIALRDSDAGSQLQESSEYQDAQGDKADQLIAGREALYRLSDNSVRIGTPVTVEQTGNDVHRNPKRVRVLVIGDSYTAGHGAYDMDVRWPRVLEDELARRVGDGVFEIVSLAQDGSSVVTQALWLKELLSGGGPTLSAWARQAGKSNDRQKLFDQALTRYQEPFDAVIIGYVDNDVIIAGGGPNEPASPAAFAPELGVASYEGLDIYAIERGEQPNPNAVLIDSAISYLASRLNTTLRLLLPLQHAKEDMPKWFESFPPYETYGFEILENPATSMVLRVLPLVDRLINPVDEHPGPVVTRAYAQDAADALLAGLASRVDEARQSAVAPTRQLVSNYLPAVLDVDTTPEQATVSFDGTFPFWCTRMPELGMGILRVIECPDGEGPNRRGSFLVDGTYTGFQTLPCITLNRPHMVVWLNRFLPPNTHVALTLKAGPDNGLTVRTVGYSADSKLFTGEPRLLGVGQTWELTVGGSVRGFALSSDANGCPREAILDQFPAFSAAIEVVP